MYTKNKTREELAQFFNTLVTTFVTRKGHKNLMEWLENETDYFTAPASTRYHGAFEGGLLAHSIEVYNNLCELVSIFDKDHTISYESIVICALFHDVCKVNSYIKGTRNEKTYDPEIVSKASVRQIKFDENGKFIWRTVPTYYFEEKFPYGGHGSKSVYLINKFITLTEKEAAAINCHMGAWDMDKNANPGPVFESNLLAFLLHVADGCATFIGHT